MIFEINIFQWLCRTEHLTVFQMECACTHPLWLDRVCELGTSQRFLPAGQAAPHRVSLCLASPRLVSRHRDPKASCLEKKMEKGRRHTQKYFIAAGVSVREGKNSDVRLTFSALQVRKWSSESLHRSVQHTFSQSYKVRFIEEFAYTKRYFNTRRAI